MIGRKTREKENKKIFLKKGLNFLFFYFAFAGGGLFRQVGKEGKNEIFGYISNDERLGVMNCHVFRLPEGTGKQITKVIQQAFEEAAKHETFVARTTTSNVARRKGRKPRDYVAAGRGQGWIYGLEGWRDVFIGQIFLCSKEKDPFAATSEEREVPSGELFDRQIRRGHLKVRGGSTLQVEERIPVLSFILGAHLSLFLSLPSLLSLFSLLSSLFSLLSSLFSLISFSFFSSLFSLSLSLFLPP